MAYIEGRPTPANGGFWNSPVKLAAAGLVLLPAIPAAVWCAAWAFRTFTAWSLGLGL